MKNFTPRAKKIIEQLPNVAARTGCNYVGSEHILLSALSLNHGGAARLIDAIGLDLNHLRVNAEKSMAYVIGHTEWRPMFSAPRDGTVILVWRCSEIQMVKWADNGCNEWWSKPDGEHISRFDKHDSGEPEEWEKPTFWMPLPKPPSSPTAEASDLKSDKCEFKSRD